MLPPTELVILIFIYMVEVYKIDLSLSFYLFQVQKRWFFKQIDRFQVKVFPKAVTNIISRSRLRRAWLCAHTNVSIPMNTWSGWPELFVAILKSLCRN